MWPFRRRETSQGSESEADPEPEKLHRVRLFSGGAGNLLGEWLVKDDFNWDTQDGVYFEVETLDGKELRILVGQNSLIMEQQK